MRLDFGEDLAKLEIRDNGKGFVPGDAADGAAGHTGYGLQSMKERLELLGGGLQIESSPGGGTTLHISVPRRSTVQAKQLHMQRRIEIAAEPYA
jgi:signal transduction histidine kinase